MSGWVSAISDDMPEIASLRLNPVNAHPGGVFSINYGQDGRIVTAGRDKAVKLWAGDGAAIKTYPAFIEPALRAVIVHDGLRLNTTIGRALQRDFGFRLGVGAAQAQHCRNGHHSE